MNVLKVLDIGYKLLKSNKINSYKIDTELLLSDSLNVSRENLILNFKQSVQKKKIQKFSLKITQKKKKRTNSLYT